MADTPRTASTINTEMSTTVMFTWSGLDGDDTGIPIKMSNYADKTVHFYSDTWGGSTATLEGSNDERANPSHANHASAKWFTLTYGADSPITTAEDDGFLVNENPLWIRPKTSSGTGASISAALVCNKAM